jgi:hypothetical protein
MPYAVGIGLSNAAARLRGNDSSLTESKATIVARHQAMREHSELLLLKAPARR